MPKHFSAGTVAFLALLVMPAAYYFMLFASSGDAWYPLAFWRDRWYWLAPFFLSFAAQMFFYQKLRIVARESPAVNGGVQKIAEASLGANLLAMVAASAYHLSHHLGALLGLFGLIGVAAAMTKYQDWFLLFGIVVNLGGAVYLRTKLRREHENLPRKKAQP